MPSMDLQPRSGTEIVDAAFQLYRRHFGPLVALTAIAFLPLFVLSPVLVAEADPEALEAAQVVGMFGLIAVAWVFGSLAEAAIVLAVSNSYLHSDPDVGGALRRTLKRLGTVIVASLFKWFVIVAVVVAAAMLGGLAVATVTGVVGGVLGSPVLAAVLAVILSLGAMAFTLLAGAHFFARYFAVSAAVMIEGLGALAAMRRSRDLSKGFRVKIALVLGIPLLVIMILNMVLGTIFEFLPMPLALTAVGQQAVNAVTYPLAGVIATLMYYDVRVRREGLDIELLAKALGSPDESSPAAAG